MKLVIMVNALSFLVGVILQFSLVSSQPVIESVTASCVPSTQEIATQSCAQRAENVCSTEDVVSEEITKEKRCKEVVNMHCGHLAHPGLKKKREANPATLQPVTKTIETPCTEVRIEHCVDVPIVVERVTPVETCHVVTRVSCNPTVGIIPRVTCAAGTPIVQ